MLKSIRKGGAVFVVVPGQHRGHRGQELAVELLAERIAADQPVGLDLDIDERRPGLVAELRQRAVEMRRRRSVPGCLKDGSTTDPPALSQRLDEVAVGSRVRRRGEIDVEGDVLHFRRF